MAEKSKDKKKSEPKLVLEREYTVPLRRGWLKVANHKRANRAITELKKFIVRHMKIYDRDLRKVKIDNYLNNEIRFRGMRKPPANIHVKAKKYDNDIVRVELVTLPKHIEFAKKRQDKMSSDIKKKVEEKPSSVSEKGSKAKAFESGTETENSKNEEKDEKKAAEAVDKEQASRDENLELAKEQAKEQKHVTKVQEAKTQNMGYKRASRTK